MKTVLPTAITTTDEAKSFLTELFKNGESFHPEDDATDIISGANETPLFTKQESKKLNNLMDEIYYLDGNNGNHATPKFDPCAFLLWLQMPTTVCDDDFKGNEYEVKKNNDNQIEVNGWSYSKTNSGQYSKDGFVDPVYERLTNVDATVSISDFVSFKRQLIAKGISLDTAFINFKSNLIDGATIKVNFNCVELVSDLFNNICIKK